MVDSFLFPTKSTTSRQRHFIDYAKRHGRFLRLTVVSVGSPGGSPTQLDLVATSEQDTASIRQVIADLSDNADAAAADKDQDSFEPLLGRYMSRAHCPTNPRNGQYLDSPMDDDQANPNQAVDAETENDTLSFGSPTWSIPLRSESRFHSKAWNFTKR